MFHVANVSIQYALFKFMKFCRDFCAALDLGASKTGRMSAPLLRLGLQWAIAPECFFYGLKACVWKAEPHLLL